MRTLTAVCLSIALTGAAAGANQSTSTPKKMTWTIDGVERTAIVCLPAKSADGLASVPCPVLFGFHGHGGKAQRMVNRYGFQKLWPEAIVVYPQGLNTPGKTDPEGKKPGWQKWVGDQNDRDLKFFDQMLEDLIQKHNVDPKQVYSSGHSNGAGFSYLLLAARNDKMAAVAVSAGGSRALRTVQKYKPRPVLHIAGRNDQIVSFAGQQRAIERIRQMNGCREKPKTIRRRGLLYESKSGTADVEFWPHDGTHRYPEKAPALIVRFLKDVSKSAASEDKKSSPEQQTETSK